MSSTTQNKTGTFTIHYFAAATTHTCKNTELLPAPLPLSNLFSELQRRYPGFEAVLSSCAVCLNGEYVDVESNGDSNGGEGGGGVVRIVDGDEVAIIPPVSSG